MSLDLPVIVLGAGGHAKVLIDALLLNKRNIIGIVDIDVNKIGDTVLGIKVVGSEDMVFNYSAEEIQLVNGLGSVKSLSVRKKMLLKFREKGYQFTNIIHPSAIIANSVKFDEGIQIMAGVVIQADSHIGSNSIINTKASIDHDCIIGGSVHVAPGVTISGGVRIGNNVHIGTGAKVIQGINIGDDSVIAAGSVVIRDVPAGVTIMGVPGKVVK